MPYEAITKVSGFLGADRAGEGMRVMVRQSVSRTRMDLCNVLDDRVMGSPFFSSLFWKILGVMVIPVRNALKIPLVFAKTVHFWSKNVLFKERVL